MKGVIEMNGIDYNLHAWKHEMWDNYIRMNEKESNIAIGKEQGIEQGISIGEDKMIRNMINSKLPLNEISAISGRSIQELEKIANM